MSTYSQIVAGILTAIVIYFGAAAIYDAWLRYKKTDEKLTGKGKK
jgi:hypothetical protein